MGITLMQANRKLLSKCATEGRFASTRWSMQKNDPVPSNEMKIDICIRKQYGRIDVTQQAPFHIIFIDQTVPNAVKTVIG